MYTLTCLDECPAYSTREIILCSRQQDCRLSLHIIPTMSPKTKFEFLLMVRVRRQLFKSEISVGACLRSCLMQPSNWNFFKLSLDFFRKIHSNLSEHNPATSLCNSRPTCTMRAFRVDLFCKVLVANEL